MTTKGLSQSQCYILGKLKNVKKESNGEYKALCPFHDDTEPSLNVNFDKGCYKCFGCGSSGSITRLAQRLVIDVLNMGGSGKGWEPVNVSSDYVQNGLTASMLTPLTGVNLKALAEAKHLPEDFLKGLGLVDTKRNGQPAVKIPYFGLDGASPALRFRLALLGENRFAWRKGDKVTLYGLNRLEQIRKAGWVLLVEGESDCWTCWYHNVPCLGVPGKSVWKLPWGDYLKGLEVFVWQEPDAEDFTLRILESAPNLRYIPAPEGIKDISEARIQGIDIPSWLEGLKGKAESGQALKVRHLDKQLADSYLQAKGIIEAGDSLDVLKAAIRGLGYGGDLQPALITYLAATSRLLEMRDGAMPVHLLLTGPSSSGKSYTLTIIKKLLPAEAYHEIDAGSPHIVIYDDAPLAHRVLIFGESDSLPAGEDSAPASAIRNLLQDHHLHYAVTIRDTETGDYKVRDVNKPGPTVLVTTSTRSLGTQLMTRLFTLEIADSKEQIGAALETQAVLEMQGLRTTDGALVAYQRYLQLKAPWRVIVPFASELAVALGNMAALTPRILRDYARLLSLVKAASVLRHHRRRTDIEGRLVAELEDYQTVRELINDTYVGSSSGATNELRALVTLVERLDVQRSTSDRITNSTLAQHLKLPVMTVSRRAKRALKQGWLVNREQRKYYPADYAPGEPMPNLEGLPVLPNVSGLTPVNTPLLTGISFENEGVNLLTPHTTGDINTSCEAIPCINGSGACPVRTDASKPFDCVYEPESCPLRHVADNGA